ncbi:hypothetical protein P9112_011113 [Eukaryota sp. TZLM1-RC]
MDPFYVRPPSTIRKERASSFSCSQSFHRKSLYSSSSPICRGSPANVFNDSHYVAQIEQNFNVDDVYSTDVNDTPTQQTVPKARPDSALSISSDPSAFEQSVGRGSRVFPFTPRSSDETPKEHAKCEGLEDHTNSKFSSVRPKPKQSVDYSFSATPISNREPNFLANLLSSSKTETVPEPVECDYDYGPSVVIPKHLLKTKH